MEPEGLLPRLEQPATFSYPEPDQTNPCPHIQPPEDSSNYYPPNYAWVFQVASFPQVSPQKPRIRLSSPHTRYIPNPSHSSRFYHLNNIG